MPLVPLPTILIEPLVREALLEDLGRAGDLTTDAIVPRDLKTRTVMAARQEGVVAGLDLAALAFRLIDPAIRFEPLVEDGAARRAGRARRDRRRAGARRAHGRARRAQFREPDERRRERDRQARARGQPHQGAHRLHPQDDAAPARDREIRGARRAAGSNHRFGLDDAVLIKDNHVAVAGSVAEAIRRARAYVGHLVKIEVEVDTLAQLEEALGVGVDAVLLDNMSLDDLKRAVAMIGGRAISEASGRVTPETARGIAETGVDLISVGWLTHSAPILDIGLDAGTRETVRAVSSASPSHPSRR